MFKLSITPQIVITPPRPDNNIRRPKFVNKIFASDVDVNLIRNTKKLKLFRKLEIFKHINTFKELSQLQHVISIHKKTLKSSISDNQKQKLNRKSKTMSFDKRFPQRKMHYLDFFDKFSQRKLTFYKSLEILKIHASTLFSYFSDSKETWLAIRSQLQRLQRHLKGLKQLRIIIMDCSFNSLFQNIMEALNQCIPYLPFLQSFVLFLDSENFGKIRMQKFSNEKNSLYQYVTKLVVKE